MSILHISDRVAAKIEERPGRGIEIGKVRAAIEGVGALPVRWDRESDRGPRALIATAIDDEAVRVVLYPSRSGNDEEWHLGSAYPDEPRE